jgi:KRAB domain-containing zinc finger protein
MLRWHEKNRHGEKTKKCEECDLMFTTALTLRQHVRTVHSRVKDKTCPVCGRAFFNGSIFQAHVNRHENNRPWKCERCEKSFLTKNHLNMHTDRHNLAYQCKQCTEKRGSASELNIHTRRVHIGDKLTCRYGCGYQSWQTGNRHRHETDCQLNPIPGAPFSVSSGSASQYTLDIYHAKLQKKVD